MCLSFDYLLSNGRNISPTAGTHLLKSQRPKLNDVPKDPNSAVSSDLLEKNGGQNIYLRTDFHR